MFGLIRHVTRIYPNNIVHKPIVRYTGHSGGIPGKNLPFRIDNPYRFTFLFTLAGVIGFGLPWIMLRHLLLR